MILDAQGGDAQRQPPERHRFPARALQPPTSAAQPQWQLELAPKALFAVKSTELVLGLGLWRPNPAAY